VNHLEHTITFRALGHQNVRSSHTTTIMITRDEHLTARGDCVVAVAAEASLSGLPEEMKEAARARDAAITLTLEVGRMSFTVTGRGHPSLSYSSAADMVARKSLYTCGRTLMVEADKAACDLPREMVRLLQSPSSEVKVTLRVQR
jgi:hypothetical protein